MRVLGQNIAGNLIAWGVIALLTYAIHRAYEGIDWPWLLVLAIGLALLSTGLVLAKHPRAATPPAQPQPEPESQLLLAVENGQRVIELPLPEKVGRFFWIYNAVVTNRSERQVSLMPSFVLQLENNNHVVLDQNVGVVPEGFTRREALLRGPLDIKPDRSVAGDFAFTLLANEAEILLGQKIEEVPPGLPVAYLLLRDLVSGEEVAHEVTHRNRSKEAEPLKVLQDRRKAPHAPPSAPSPPPSSLMPYERLEVIEGEGEILLQERGTLLPDIDLLIRGTNKVAKWTARASKEIQLVAPQYYAEWIKGVRKTDLGTKGLQARLELLGGILSRLRGGGPGGI